MQHRSMRIDVDRHRSTGVNATITDRRESTRRSRINVGRLQIGVSRKAVSVTKVRAETIVKY